MRVNETTERLSKSPKARKIYLDACILISYFSNNKEEKNKQQVLKECFKRLEELESVTFFTSHWALAETVNILVCRHEMKESKVAKFEQELLHTERLGNLKVKVLDASLKKDYSVKEYLYHVRKAVIKYHAGVGDSMHWVVIDNHKIDTILTFDNKKDFKQIPGLTVIHPESFLSATEI